MRIAIILLVYLAACLTQIVSAKESENITTRVAESPLSLWLAANLNQESIDPKFIDQLKGWISENEEKNVLVDTFAKFAKNRGDWIVSNDLNGFWFSKNEERHRLTFNHSRASITLTYDDIAPMEFNRTDPLMKVLNSFRSLKKNKSAWNWIIEAVAWAEPEPFPELFEAPMISLFVAIKSREFDADSKEAKRLYGDINYAYINSNIFLKENTLGRAADFFGNITGGIFKSFPGPQIKCNPLVVMAGLWIPGNTKKYTLKEISDSEMELKIKTPDHKTEDSFEENTYRCLFNDSNGTYRCYQCAASGTCQKPGEMPTLYSTFRHQLKNVFGDGYPIHEREKQFNAFRWKCKNAKLTCNFDSLEVISGGTEKDRDEAARLVYNLKRGADGRYYGVLAHLTDQLYVARSLNECCKLKECRDRMYRLSTTTLDDSKAAQ